MPIIFKLRVYILSAVVVTSGITVCSVNAEPKSTAVIVHSGKNNTKAKTAKEKSPTIIVRQRPNITKPKISSVSKIHLPQISYGRPLSESEKTSIKSMVDQISASETSDPRRRVSITAQIVAMGNGAIPILLESMKSPNARQSRSAGLALIDFGDAAVPGVVKVFQQSPSAYESGILVFDYLKAPGIKGLSTLLTNTDANVRSRAATCMSRSLSYMNLPGLNADVRIPLPAEVVPVVTWSVLTDPNETVRASAAEILRWAAPTGNELQALEYVALNDQAESVRSAAAGALVTAIPRQNSAYNRPLLQVLGYVAQRDTSERVKLALIKSIVDCAKSPNGEGLGPLIPYIRPMFTDRSEAVKSAFIGSLGQMRPNTITGAIPELIAGLDDPICRNNAAWALANMGHSASAAVPKLQKMHADPAQNTDEINRALGCIVGKDANRWSQ